VRVLRGALERELYAHLPPSYATSERRYPVLYMHDGRNLFDEATSHAGEWRVDETVDALADEGIEAIVVGIPQGPDRGSEYVPSKGGPEYVSFLVDQVKSLVDESLRTLPERKTTGLAGSSLGGIISLYGFLTRNDLFSYAGVMSPAFWWDESLYDLAATTPRRDGRIWMDVGSDEHPENPERTKAYLEAFARMSNILRARGYDKSRLHTIVEPGARHHETAWARRLPGMLRFLLPVAG
jgi:predicted alpha/beta superfamily hydrolase